MAVVEAASEEEKHQEAADGDGHDHQCGRLHVTRPVGRAVTLVAVQSVAAGVVGGTGRGQTLVDVRAAVGAAVAPWTPARVADEPWQDGTVRGVVMGVRMMMMVMMILLLLLLILQLLILLLLLLVILPPLQLQVLLQHINTITTTNTTTLYYFYYR